MSYVLAGSVQCLAFPFDIVSDTVDAVAKEMQEDFDLTAAEAEVFRSLLKEEVINAEPLLKIGTNTSAPLPPVPAGGTSSEMTASCCEDALSEFQAATSTSEPCLSTDAITSNRSDVQETVGNRLEGCEDKTGQMRCSVCCVGIDPPQGRSREHVVLAEGQTHIARLSEEFDTTMAIRSGGSGEKRGLRVQSLMRKRCASEPCLLLNDVCNYETRVVSSISPQSLPMKISPPGSPASENTDVATSDPVQERLEGGAGTIAQSSGCCQSEVVLKGLKAAALVPPKSTQDTVVIKKSKQGVGEGANGQECAVVAAEALAIDVVESSTEQCACDSGETSSGVVPHPVDMSGLSGGGYDGQVVRTQTGQLLQKSERNLAGMIGGLTRRRTWSSSLFFQQHQEEHRHGVCQWSEQEVKLLDLNLSTRLVRLAGCGDTKTSGLPRVSGWSSGGSLENCAPNRWHKGQMGRGDESCCLKAYHGYSAAGVANPRCRWEDHGANSRFEKYATILRGKSSVCRLNAKMHGHTRQQSVKEFRWRMESAEMGDVCRENVGRCPDMAGGNGVRQLARSASVPVTSSMSLLCSGPQLSPCPLTTRHSSPCASIQRDRTLWKKLAMRAMTRRQAEQKLDSMESQILESLNLFRCSPGLCAPVGQRQNSSPIMSGLEAM